MSSVWFTLINIFCLSCTALSDQGSSGVTWKTIGASITITCSPSMDEDPLKLEGVSLRKGLEKEVEVVFLDKSGKVTIKQELQTRAKKTNDEMKKLDVTITNLTRADTGLYQCIYDKLDENFTPIQTEGTGSVLLVVEDIRSMPCEKSDPISSQPPSTVLLVVCALTGGSVLLISVIVLIIWGIPRMKNYFSSFTPTRVNTNDVYEDMRSTLRRRDDRPIRGQQPLSQQYP